MYIQLGQLKDIQKHFPEVKKEDCSILVEFGNDNGETFGGSFTVQIKKRGIYRFKDGSLFSKKN
jgi:hypothetical protein